MKKTLKVSGYTVVFLTLLIMLAIVTRHHLVSYALAIEADVELKPAGDEGVGTEWFDDYYTIFRIDDRTFAIGETRYWQNNFNYLIIGDEQAILFDAGPGLRDIRPVVASLTSLPVLFIPSHLHYDHIGNSVTFERVGIIDVPHLRNRAAGNRLVPEELEHYGGAEDIDAPTLHITDWLVPGSNVQLGGRVIDIVYTPGHTADSVSLVDAVSGYAFTGDFFVPHTNGVFFYGGKVGDYFQGISSLLSVATDETRVFGAHRPIYTDESPPLGIPETSMQDLQDMEDALLAIREMAASRPQSLPGGLHN